MIIASSTVKAPAPAKALAIKYKFSQQAQAQSQAKIESRDELWRQQEAVLLEELQKRRS